MKNNNRIYKRLRLGLGFGLDFFYFILISPPMNRDATSSRLSLEEKNMSRQCQMNTLFTTFEWYYALWMALLYSKFPIFNSPSPNITTTPPINWNFGNVQLFELVVKNVLSHEKQKNDSRGTSQRQTWRTLFWEREACRRK